MISAEEKHRVGMLIKRRRQQMGYRSQDAFAARLGVSRATVAAWESGKHYPARWLGDLEGVLGVSLTAEDPEEAELLASLTRLHESGLIEGVDVEYQMKKYQERKRRAVHPGLGERAS